VSAKVERVYEDAIRALREAGAIVVDPVDLPTARKIGDVEFEVLLYEFKDGLNAYFATRAGVPVKTLADLIAFNEQHAAEELEFFGQEILVDAQEKGPLSDPAYRKARSECVKLARKEGLDAVLAKHRLDALVAPDRRAPRGSSDLVNGDSDTGRQLCAGGCGRLSQRDRAHGHGPRPAGRPLDLRRGLERGAPSSSTPTRSSRRRRLGDHRRWRGRCRWRPCRERPLPRGRVAVVRGGALRRMGADRAAVRTESWNSSPHSTSDRGSCTSRSPGARVRS